MENYKIILYCGREGQLIAAEVPELPGCTANGKTKEEALVNARHAIRQWIERHGKSGPPAIDTRQGQFIYA